MEYSTSSHTKFLLLIHVILVVKYRKPLLIGKVTETLKLSLAELADRSEFTTEEMEVDRDHLHVLIAITPRYSVSQYVRRIKQQTTLTLWKEFPFLYRHFWRERTFWSDGYFACSIGNASEETIRRYIQEQG
ncbi:IS200/IS605 family transposase [Photobacterium sp. ZSDE20]|uniref:IS200/IS605 family transposase n=1 Tax=Photobacterium pectinilyticum TaxID=2906793 RepID=A0ABT1MWZ0_9GAMM|nr:IS200/IS605 family transposase [Photobacterium sp. ZSDE20]MCQ1057018.1 IS200/IS605 family transposase [Photobacterium sp. ZSDE20]MDD1821153.1 IS200/IS605 family transposase [Photobacterium sp. ZSDE20]